jgi:hypothetical protein
MTITMGKLSCSFVHGRSVVFGPRWQRSMLGLILGCFALSIAISLAHGETVGHCRFDSKSLSFAGTAKEQARCLLRPVAKWGRVGTDPITLPNNLDGLIGNQVQISRQILETALRSKGFTEATVGGPLDQGLSHGQARYFVIHDTSSPWFGDRQFPSDIDTSESVNNLRQYAVRDAVAHMFINRRGEMLVGHQLSVPWRATKLEREVGIPSKGMFIHVESIQPRRRDPSGGPKNDAIAPEPGLTQEQYDRLALLYVVASSRSGIWMIPAFHAAIDEGISDAHDDPQNFELLKFDVSVGQLLASMR